MSDPRAIDWAAPGSEALSGGFIGLVGLRIVEANATRVVATLEATSQHWQPAGLMHGGVHAMIVESLGSIGGHLAVRDRGMTVVGVSNATDFLRPHRSGPVSAVGEPIHVGRSQQLWQVVITRDDGAVLARGQVRLQNIAANGARDATVA